MEDSVLIHTFLFLTMDGTPEGTELWRQLRLSRGDKAYLGLDDIVTFSHAYSPVNHCVGRVIHLLNQKVRRAITLKQSRLIAPCFFTHQNIFWLDTLAASATSRQAKVKRLRRI